MGLSNEGVNHSRMVYNRLYALTQHALTRHDDLLWLFLHGQRTDQSGNFFGRLPFRQLTQTLLSGPHACVNDLQEQLARPRVENENGSVCKEISLGYSGLMALTY